MKIYKHTWNWHYIGCQIIILESNLELATYRIRDLLDKAWLENEECDIEEIGIDKPDVILMNDWEY